MNCCRRNDVVGVADAGFPDFGESGFGGLSDLRRILSQQGLHADETQERTLLELIYKSCRRSQYKKH